MSEPIAAGLAIAMLLSLTSWLSVRMAAGSDLSVLSSACRRRVRWWETHARNLYLGCACLAVALVVLQIGKFA
jgi:hypothetical protein